MQSLRKPALLNRLAGEFVALAVCGAMLVSIVLSSNRSWHEAFHLWGSQVSVHGGCGHTHHQAGMPRAGAESDSPEPASPDDFCAAQFLSTGLADSFHLAAPSVVSPSRYTWDQPDMRSTVVLRRMIELPPGRAPPSLVSGRSPA
ncbi:MAG: hypothetical protein FJ405_12480 [Verrucomicrobia bacterium]|nr:hypothetical protein [Verrucomicrobiota bacterium]